MKDLKELRKDIARATKEVNKRLSKKLFKNLGEQNLKDIKDNLQSGYGTNDQGLKKRYKGLKSSTKKTRQSLKKNGKLDSRTTPSQSNQISSGNMLDSIKMKVNSDGYEIAPSNKKGREAAEHQDKDRPTFNVSKEQMKNIDEALDDIFDETFGEIFK